ncbi:2-oxoglutarate-acceptor oxidoreductase subunit OorB [Helicobacter sp. NHP19-012]|uniref:2-oxoglutarate-acceptor oxidoreductase subunit OorB n=1 Tax=Helicobacter gastrofelis TaxID=2849642 RepID=A0ABM7SG33_9HELI|nr:MULTISPECIES: 2-oxoglutarate ferredoxin oxidoreductase subunit beta [unclassified Helicobacter]BCZ19809.1 2-oxoglutarate-acceptor oxidoreductase subunit OorB [Helicobacter sp. NHP19-012]GMB95484.1 2-oxoglutarate-acceptor oxidoreductase subunit OorB [Helicobacter sp. NHP22-001]
MAFDYDTYLRVDKTPTLWCWGCGDGVILKSIIRAIDTLGWDMDDVCFVSGIGCSGRMSSYVNCNTVHTTHGRALAYATGIKMANPTKHVIVVSGDGDSFAIGGNHTIHACRRNIDLNLVLVDNFIYGLTNSQTSPTTPNGMWTVTAQGGNIDNSFDPCEIAMAAGASFVGRESVLEPKKLERILTDAFNHKGFSFVDVHSNCHINLGRKNKMGEAAQTLKWIESRLVSRRKYEEMTPEERVGKFPTGVLRHDTSKMEYCQAYQGVIDKAQAKKA